MANVYDSVTREEAIRHAQFSCGDEKSTRIILDLVGWLDRHQAAETQRTISDQQLELSAAQRECSRLASRVEELEKCLAEANTLLWSQGIDGVYPDALSQARNK